MDSFRPLVYTRIARWTVCVPVARLVGWWFPGMDRLTIFGLFAVTAMLVSYALEKRSPWFILAFSGS